MNWVYSALLAQICIASMILILRSVANTGLPTLLIMMYLFFFTFILFLSASVKSLIVPKMSILFFILIASFCSFAGNYFGLNAVRQAPNVGYVTAIGTLSIIITTIFSIVIFKHSLTVNGIIGICFVVIGIILISFKEVL